MIGSNLCTGVRAAACPKRPADRLSSSSCRSGPAPEGCLHRAIRTAGATRRPGFRKEVLPPTEESPDVDRAEKKAAIASLNGVFKATNVVVVAHYSGLTVAQMQTLRKQMRAGWRLGEGREKPPRQDRSRRHGRRVHRPPAEGPDADRLLERSGRGAQGRRRLRQGEREVRHPRRSDGQDRPEPDGVKALASLPSLDELRAKLVGLLVARRPRSRSSPTRRPPSSRAWSRPMPRRAKPREASRTTHWFEPNKGT